MVNDTKAHQEESALPTLRPPAPPIPRPLFDPTNSSPWPLWSLSRETRTPVLGLAVTAPVDSVGSVYHAVSACRRISEEFTADGSVVLRVKVEVDKASFFFFTSYLVSALRT